MDSPRDELQRRAFSTLVTLTAQKNSVTLRKGLVDCGCSGANVVINEAVVESVCEQLGISPLPLPKPKPLRGYDGQLARKSITHFILLNMIVNGHWESSSSILIANLGQHDIILGKPWMNRHGVLLDMMRDKILFVPGRCQHDGNVVSAATELSFVTSQGQSPNIIQALAITSSEQSPSVRTSRSRRPSPSFKPAILHRTTEDIPANTSAEKLNVSPIDGSECLDIAEISAASFFMSAKDQDNKLFSLTLNEIAPQSQSESQRTSRIARNGPCPCGSQYKYKRCCGSNIKAEPTIEISEVADLNQDEIKQRLPEEYYDFVDVFDRAKANILPPHRPYDHRVEFAENVDETKLPKSRIYLMLGHKLE